MPITRRAFLAMTAASAGSLCSVGCMITNPAPTFAAADDGTLPLPEPLMKPGGQVKVKLRGVDHPVLVWSTAQGLAATTVICTHRGCEVAFNHEAETIDCPCHGSRFHPDGTVLRGPARRPLQAYKATREGDRLRIEPL